MIATTHRIRRLRWRVRAGTQAEAFAVRLRLRRMHEAGLLTELERAFDATAVGDEVVHIPRLELTLRVSDLDQIGPALAAGIYREIADLRTSQPHAGAAAARGERPGLAVSSPLSGVDALFWYLDTGVLPWPLANAGRERTLALLTDASAGDPDRILAHVRPPLRRAVAFLFRWLQLVPEAQWIDIAHRVERAAPAGKLSGLVDAIRSLGETRAPAIGPHGRQRLASALLAVAIKSRGDLGSTDAHDAEAVISTIVSTLGAGAPSTDTAAIIDRLPAEAAAWVRKHILPPASPAADRTSRTPAARGQTGQRTAAVRPAAPSAPAEPNPPAGALHTPEDSDAAERDEADAFGIAVDHAGLVLLHPFLPRLFEQTGVLRAGDTSLPDDVLPRAAALLFFAARGVDEPFEFELGLIKVLLGLRPDADLQVSAGLIGPADGEEVDALLHSVIEHWRVLKHTSIAGVRGSFLQRPGLLAEVDGFWRLRVEQQPFDVLLDQLPWAISTIRLPWMTVPLFTEWATP